MKQLIAVVAVIILGIAVGGIIVGFSSTADNIGTQADALGQGLISEDGQWMGAIGSGPEAPGVPQEPDPYEGMGVISTHPLGDAVVGTLYENGDLVVSGSGAMKDYATANDAPFGTSRNPNTSIKRVIIKDGVTTVGELAFYYCKGLTSVTIPDSVTSIGNYAFSDCSSLTSVTIGNSVESIGNHAFWRCTSLTSIVTNSDNLNYSSVNGVLFNKNKTTLVKYPQGKTQTSYTIPDSVTSIGNSAFYECSRLTSVAIGDSVTSIGDWAFYNCSSLASVTIGDSVTSIGDFAFRGCSSLTSITIPDSVTSIGNYAFQDCSSLTSITIPDSVTSIGNYAFYKCSSLTSITIPDSVTSIGIVAFYGCSSLTSITIPDSVTSIGSSAFQSCSSLTSVRFQGNAPTYGTDIFKDTPSTLKVYRKSGTTGWGSTWGDPSRTVESW